jgi:sugar lactone lactonase YvrE
MVVRMTARTLTPLLEGGSFFEGPRWHDGRWWVSDFYRHAVYTVSTDGDADVVLEVEHQPSGLGWLPDGSLLVVSMKDQRLLRRNASAAVSVHADLSAFTDSSLNDMVVDARGRAWIGCFGFDLMAGAQPQTVPLMRVDPDGTATIAAEELMFPNGSVITPDGSTLIVGETAGCRYTAFTISGDGSLSDRRIWAQLAPAPELAPLEQMLPQIAVGPDGCTLDAEGHIWSAEEAGGDFLEHNRQDARDAVLMTTTVEVPHAGLP